MQVSVIRGKMKATQDRVGASRRRPGWGRDARMGWGFGDQQRWRAEDEMKPGVAEWPAALFQAVCIPARRFLNSL